MIFTSKKKIKQFIDERLADYKEFVGGELARLQDSILYIQRNIKALEGITSEISVESNDHEKNLGTLFKKIAEKAQEIQTLEDQFKFFKKKQLKGASCQKSCTKK